MDSVDVPEELWEEKHRNDSRPWLLKHGCEGQYRSTVKDDYVIPKFPRDPAKEGIRRRKLKEQLWEECTQEVMKKKEEDANIAEYCSTYDTDFQKDGFKVSELTTEQTELHRKYPLYTSNPLTCYQGVVDKSLKMPAPLSNMSKICDISSPFKRSFAFSKPLDQRFDDPD